MSQTPLYCSGSLNQSSSQNAYFCYFLFLAQDYQDIEQPGAYAVDPPLPVATPVSDNHVAQQTPVPQQQQATRVVLVSTHDPTLTRNPMLMRQCPSCQQESRTRIRTSPTWQTWLASLVLLFLFWPICWIPLVLDAAKQTDHFCVLW